MKGESSQKPIKINADLWYLLDEWLKTDDAKKRGHNSKAQFATEAIREKLEEYGMYQFTSNQIKIISEMMQDTIENYIRIHNFFSKKDLKIPDVLKQYLKSKKSHSNNEAISKIQYIQELGMLTKAYEYVISENSKSNNTKKKN
jgi:DNA polymerase III delta prime subunit